MRSAGARQRYSPNTYRRCISQLIFFPRQDLPENTSHDLAGPGLGQIVNHEDRFRCGEGPDGFPDLLDEILADLVVGLAATFQGYEGVDRLARELVVDAHHSCLGNLVWGEKSALERYGNYMSLTMLDKCGLNLRGGQSVPGDVDDVIDTATDPVVAFMITPGTISGELISVRNRMTNNGASYSRNTLYTR